MSTLTPMVEYLLALRTTAGGGGQLVRFGGIQITVPIFPAGMSITWELTPYFGSYCSIEYWHRFSPSIVPGAFLFNSTHSGMVTQAGILGTTLLAESHSTWLEITESDPILTTITNVSGVNQFFENVESFLLVDSEDKLQVIREVVRNWGKFEANGSKIDETNDLLRQILGREAIYEPQPPITGGRR